MDSAGTSFDEAPVPPVVTLSAYYGAGGSVVGTQVADRLGVPFLDRGIPAGVAEQLRVPEETASQYDAEVAKPHLSLARRIFDNLGRSATSADVNPVSTRERDENRYRRSTEEFLVRSTTHGGVVLGRGGMVVLRWIPGVLHVKLDGSREARIAQAMRLQSVDRRTAERRLEANDRARVSYVRRVYGVDPETEPLLFHLALDSTAIDLDTCVDLIVTAAHARARQRSQPQPAAGQEQAPPGGTS